MLSLLPVSGATRPHKSVLVGDLKLADFKQFLSTKGVQVILQLQAYSTDSFSHRLSENGVISTSFP